jgi:hypothetical protein
MRWAENRGAFTAESLEIKYRQVMASFILRESIELIGLEAVTGTAVIWCGLHDIDWQGRQCDTGFWVRKSAHGQGFATEATNALVRLPSERSGCGGLVLRTQAAMRLADALLKDLASHSRVYRGMRIYFRAKSARTGTATLDSMLLVYPT